MNRKLMLLGIAAAAIFALTPAVSTLHAQGNGIVALANGSGQVTLGPELRTFSFSAQKDSSNVSKGQAELFSRSANVRFHIEINCLNVVGSTATMSGKITQDNKDGAFVGNDVWFRVVDNGHGPSSPPDLISLVYYFIGGPGVPCTSPLAAANIPIEGGNITVH